MSSSSIYGAAPVSISGLSSGLDTQSIINALTTQEAGVESQLQNQETTVNSALTEWQTINTSIAGLQSIVQTLASPETFDTSQATIDQSGVASVGASPGATAGAHTLTVNTLAKAQQVLSGSFSDPSTPLNIAGNFNLNGKTITLAATDTLNNVVTKIQNASAGVNVSVVNSGTGNYQLSLTASGTGTINTISASDIGTGTALESLGLIPSTNPVVGLRQSITTASGGTGAGTLAFKSSSENIGTLLGAASGSAPSGTVQIGGKSISLNLNTQSLTDIANSINTAGITGVTAQIVSVPDSSGNTNPASPKQLQIIGASGTPISASSFTDSGGVLSSLGITQTAYANQVSAASDASFNLDGVNYTRSSNAVNNVIPDVTISLTATNNSATSTPANITVSQNVSDITNTLNSFVTAYNGVVDAINAQQTFTPTTSGATGTAQTSPPLFGDFTLTNIQSSLSNLLNVTSGSSSLATIGLSVNATGDIAIDPSQLATALASNPQQVAGLFTAAGSTTNAALTYNAAGANTQSSSALGYAVNITQAATQASVSAGAPFQTLAQAESLSFSGGLFGSGSTSLSLASGTTLAQAIQDINNSGNLNQYLFASQSTSGALVLTSKGYGSNQSFSVVSNKKGAGTTQIGETALTATGDDLKGTINGEIATGDGQSLIGNTGNKTTDGLQLTYTGTATGNIGNVIVTQGLGSQLGNYLNGVTDTNTGAVITAENALNSQLTDLQTQVTEQQTEVAAYQQQLTTEFNNMETALSTLKAQQSAFNAETSSPSSSSSSGSTSASSSSSSGSSAAAG